jgi:hypothetical protein
MFRRPGARDSPLFLLLTGSGRCPPAAASACSRAVLAEKCCRNGYFGGLKTDNSVIPFAMENLALIFRRDRNTVHIAWRFLNDL